MLVFRSTVDNVIPRSSVETLLRLAGSEDLTVVELTRSQHVATLDYEAPLIFERSLAFVERVTHRPPARTEAVAT